MTIDRPIHQKVTKRGKTVAQVAGLAIALAALPGCQSLAGNPSLSQVRIIDTSPDAGGGAIDVYQGGSPLAYNVGFGDASSYVPISPGTSAVVADTAGTKQQLISASGTFLANAQYTVVFSNYAALLGETILKDQSQPAPANEIAVRILDESLKTGAVDLYMVPTGSTLATTQPLQTGVAFGANTGYLNLPAGIYSFVAVTHGVVVSAATVTLYTGSTVTYPVSAVRTIVLTDNPTSTSQPISVNVLADYDSPSEGS
jgi:hypothetical protein